MSIGHRLQRLERAHEERVLRKEAERLAERYGLDADDILHEYYEMGARVTRYGLDAEVRLLAQEFGKTEDEIRADLAALTEEYEKA